MPQPYSGPYVASPQALLERPVLAQHIALIAAQWSILELSFGELLAHMLHSEALTGVLLYSCMKSEPARIETLQTVAEDRLPPEDQKTFSAIQKKMKSISHQRGNLVHNIWGVPAEIAGRVFAPIPASKRNTLILLDSRAMLIERAAATGSINRQSIPLSRTVEQHDVVRETQIIERHQAALSASRDSVLEYQERDFIFIEQQIAELAQDVAKFAVRLAELNPPPTPVSPERLV